MLHHVHVTPIAAESLGVRSMCTYVETPDARILLDAGVSLCPNRFRLSPHPTEFKAIVDARQRIAEAANNAEFVTISHYHYDHHTPSFEDWLVNWTSADETAAQIYTGKTVWVKNFREQINSSQRERGWLFARTGGRNAKQLLSADAKVFTVGETRVKFSEPVPHGPEQSDLGWVLMTTVEHGGEKFVFAPDVQGPMSDKTVRLILDENPELLMIGGPPSYLSPTKILEEELQRALLNLTKLVLKVRHVILDHHILRDEEWQKKATNVLYESYEHGTTLQTAAEYLGKDNSYLEATRRQLYEQNPPGEEFKKWMKTNEETRKHTKPPL